MLAAIVLAAVINGAPQYVADQAPSKTIKLDPKQICTAGYVDPAKLVVQIMYQLEMYDELTQLSGDQARIYFDGSSCPPGRPEDADVLAGPGPGVPDKKGFCTGAIVVQRLLLNVYPGYRPIAGWANMSAVTIDDLQRDVADQPEGLHGSVNARQNISNFARRFLNSQASDHLVRCDYVTIKPPKPDDPKPPAKDGLPATTPLLALAPPAQLPDRRHIKDEDELARSRPGAQVAVAAQTVQSFLKLLKWRQMPGNLIYRASSDSYDTADPTYIVGQDLYLSDGGFKLAFNETGGADTDDKPSRAYERNIIGAVGLPICGVFLQGAYCHGDDNVEGNPKAYRTNYDVILYGSVDTEYKKTTFLDTPPSTPTHTRKNQLSELGAVSFYSSENTPLGCFPQFVFGQGLSHCATYFVARGFQARNDVDGSRFNGLALRYVPLLRLYGAPGLWPKDVCVNSVCGDPDRMLRWGVLFDARADFGWYQNRGSDPKLLPFNDDYTRIGARAGLLSVFKPLPDTPITLWAAYTALHAATGYRRGEDIDDLQSQASVTFGAATLSLSYRNGRREDTAHRDETWQVGLGFKSK